MKIEWINRLEALPNPGEWVLIYLPDAPRRDPDPSGVYKCGIAALYYPSPEHHMPNNRGLPYVWDEFGPGQHFGHEVSHWARITIPGV